MQKYKNYFLLLIPFLILIALFLMNNPSEEEIIYSNYEKSNLIKVYVFGEVLNPGEYYLKEGSTQLDLINKCGKTDYTNQSDLKLSTVLVNGNSYEVLMMVDNEKQVTVTMKVSSYIPNIEITSNNTFNSLININEASLESLITLTGIGSTRALSIIEYRKTSKFLKTEDLMLVNGISEKIYNAIKDYITV